MDIQVGLGACGLIRIMVSGCGLDFVTLGFRLLLQSLGMTVWGGRGFSERKHVNMLPRSWEI